MHTITLQCRTVTPMFSGNAFQKPEIRPTEIKAAMRFWWRAMNGHLPLAELKKQEVLLFGGQYKENPSDSEFEIRRSSFSIVVEANPTISHNQLPDKPCRAGSRTFNILNYLAFGKWDYRKGFVNGYIPVNQTFTVHLSMQDSSMENVLRELLWFVGNLGGIGSKTRNGYGRFSLDDQFTLNPADVIIRKLVDTQLAKYTALSDKVEVFQTQPLNAWQDALEKVGIAYLESRSNIGNDKYVGDKRKYIGFPLSVREKNGPGMIVKKIDDTIERHAKSYFLTVIQEGRGQFRGLIVFIPYLYLEGSQLDPASINAHRTNYNTHTSTFNGLLTAKLTKVI